jgi:hypothetical protein
MQKVIRSSQWLGLTSFPAIDTGVCLLLSIFFVVQLKYDACV